ncbi:MAG: Hint domain-containing protein [Pseudomonadota bacterium]
MTITDEFFVEVIDDDGQLEASDGNNTTQFEPTDLPADFVNDSETFQTFETYTGTDAGGNTVTFTLIQFSSSLYMFVTEGSVEVGDTIFGTNNNIVTAPDVDYTDLPDFVCFTKGSLVETPNGAVAIETLKPGDLVNIAGDEPKEVRWIGTRRLTAREVWMNPHLRPVRIKADALGPGVPSRDVRVSQQHRVAVTAAASELLFGTNELLVPARFLVNGSTIVIEEGPLDVEFIHLLFDQHELVNVAGLWSESFFLGDTVGDEMSEAVRAEILELFPELAKSSAADSVTKFKVLRKFEAEAIDSHFSAYQPETAIH